MTMTGSEGGAEPAGEGGRVGRAPAEGVACTAPEADGGQNPWPV